MHGQLTIIRAETQEGERPHSRRHTLPGVAGAHLEHARLVASADGVRLRVGVRPARRTSGQRESEGEQDSHSIRIPEPLPARLPIVSPFQPSPVAYAEASDFNERYPVGTRVSVRRDDGTVTRTKTRSRAWVLAGVCPVVMVEGIRGAYLLSRVTVIA